jgi:glucose/arabinose dehydrogenase
MLALLAVLAQEGAQEGAPPATEAPPAGPRESEHYRIETFDVPDGIVLEVSAIAVLPDGRSLVATRRGEVWIVEERAEEPPVFELFAEGLQEPLGLVVHADGWIYVGQRGELSRLRDADGDDLAEELETVCDAWRISGNYHEYLFGPVLGPDGSFWVTTNSPFGDEPFGSVDWRGFALRITPDGGMTPVACGLRSPAGVGFSPGGDLFYTDNQGEWCGASKLSHVEPGDFHGHPWGIGSCELPEWKHPRPLDPRDGLLMPLVPERDPTFKLPAVWFPYDKMGKSPAGFVWDESNGAFGPFAGQLFVGDQHHASVMRVFLEEVDGHWQGACFPFRQGFLSGIVRLAWGADGALLVGMTNRGWGSRGGAAQGLQRLVWTGVTPFEVRTMSARPDGFELTFTAPVDAAAAGSVAAYRLESYTYEHHEAYGSAEMDVAEPRITAARVSDDRATVRLVVDGLRAGYVHELHLPGVRSADGEPLLHDEAYYTLIRIP